MKNIIIACAFALALAAGYGVHVSTQQPFLVFGSQSGTAVAIKSTSNALWVSLQSAPSLTITATAFGSLPASTNGTIMYCNDCTVTTAATCPGTQASCVCTGSGTGAIARRIAGAWYCTP